MIYSLGLKSGNSLLIETDFNLVEICEAKRDCIKSMIFSKIEYNNNLKLCKEVLVDLYSIETMEEVIENKKK